LFSALLIFGLGDYPAWHRREAKAPA
jgi:hypothetical protein